MGSTPTTHDPNAPRHHDCIGNPGYPVREIMMRREGGELIVEYYRDDVAIGDLMTVGLNVTTARTYVIRGIRPSPYREGALCLALESTPMPVTVAGKTYS